MDEAILAASAVYMFSTYNNYLNVILKKTKKHDISKFRAKEKVLKKRRNRQVINRHMLKLLSEPKGEFWSFVRISNTDFEDLIHKMFRNIPQDNRWKASIPHKVKLALTLRYLMTGESYESLHSVFHIPTSVISRVIYEVCIAINDILKDMIKLPSNKDEWLAKTEGFNFPHCLGALDSKHVIIMPQCPTEYEQDFKTSFSVVLLTLVDSDYCFISADVGINDCVNNCDELNQTILWQQIASNSLNLPSDKPLPGGSTNMPYVFLGDEAFPLSRHVMIPFSDDAALGTPERYFNQRLECSRVFVDNTFGLLSSVFRVLQKPLPLDAEKSAAVTLSCILLHNYLRKSETSRDIYSPPGSFDLYDNNALVVHGMWRNNQLNNFVLFQPLSCRTEDESAFQTRLDFMDYLSENKT